MRTLLALLFLVSACGGGSDSPPDAGPDAGGDVTTVESFCADFSERICDGLVGCSCRFDVRAYDVDGCVAARTTECIGGLGGGVGADLASGAARFDEAAVTACLAAVEEMAAACTLDTVSLTAPLPFECARLVGANAGIGDACLLSGGGLAFCADGAGVCQGDGAGATCTALPAVDQACPQGLCGVGLVCDGGTCAEPRASGETCAAPTSCADGLVCDPTGHCAAPLAADAACDVTAQCAEGLACDGTGHCAALVAIGDGCSDPSVCGAARSCERAPETRTCTDPDADGASCQEGTCGTASLCAQAGTCSRSRATPRRASTATPAPTVSPVSTVRAPARRSPVSARPAPSATGSAPTASAAASPTTPASPAPAMARSACSTRSTTSAPTASAASSAPPRARASR